LHKISIFYLTGCTKEHQKTVIGTYFTLQQYVQDNKPLMISIITEIYQLLGHFKTIDWLTLDNQKIILTNFSVEYVFKLSFFLSLWTLK